VIVVAAFEAPTVVATFDDVAVVSETVEQRGGHLCIAEHAGPFTEGKIGGSMKNIEMASQRPAMSVENSAIPAADPAISH
jgi:hypothetical protein